jgi:hypothetical protein
MESSGHLLYLVKRPRFSKILANFDYDVTVDLECTKLEQDTAVRLQTVGSQSWYTYSLLPLRGSENGCKREDEGTKTMLIFSI